MPGSQGYLFYRDSDGDGFGAAASVRACVAPAGYVMNNTDCDDTRAAVRPSAGAHARPGFDENSDGAEPCYPDADGDHHRHRGCGCHAE